MSRSGKHYLRTILLGIVAMAALVWMAVDQFDLAPRVLGEMFLTTLVVAAAVIICAGLAALLWVGLRKLTRREPR